MKIENLMTRIAQEHEATMARQLEWQATGGWDSKRNMSNRAAAALDAGDMTLPMVQKLLKSKFKISLSKEFLENELRKLEHRPAWHHVGKTQRKVWFYSKDAIEELLEWIGEEIAANRAIDADEQVWIFLGDGFTLQEVRGVRKGQKLFGENGVVYKIKPRAQKHTRGVFVFHAYETVEARSRREAADARFLAKATHA